MKHNADCIPCITDHMVRTAKAIAPDPEKHEKIISMALEVISRKAFKCPPPFIAREIQKIMSEVTGIEDIFRDEKDICTKVALDLFPGISAEISASEYPFENAVKAAIGSNIIDFGVSHCFDIESIHSYLSKSLDTDMDHDRVRTLEVALNTAKNVLFIGDNCGEVVFDRLILERFSHKTTFAVRGFPILNDATRREAEMSGFPDLMKIVDTGDSTPGIDMDSCSEEFIGAFEDADLIISKGQGNYETLCDIRKPVFFLLKTKCHVIASELGNDIGTMNLIAKNISSVN